MQTKWKYLIGGFLGIIIVTSVVVPVTIHFLQKEGPVDQFSIYIDSDEDFIEYSFPGVGTQNDPYVIENYSITTSSNYGIFIFGTTKYFIIRNCILTAKAYGIYIDHIANETALISQNICNNQDTGIVSFGSLGLLIRNNICNNNAYSGIHLSRCSDAILDNNTCINNNEAGISFSSPEDLSFNATLKNNTCANNNYGIHLLDLTGTTVNNNLLTFNSRGIYVENSNEATISNNTCLNNGFGIHLESSSDNTLISNRCNKNALGIEVEFSQRNCLINNICNNNSNYLHGIRLADSPNTNIINNTCLFNGCGVFLWRDNPNTVMSKNNCSNNIYGFSIGSSFNNSLTNNTCNNNEIGIQVLSSSSPFLANNTLANNVRGIALWFSTMNASVIDNIFINCGLDVHFNSVAAHYTYNIENNLINGKQLGFFISETNTIISDPIYGQLILINCSDIIVRNQEINDATIGLTLIEIENSTLTNNTCENHWTGIFIDYSYNVTLTNNTCNYNNWAGIYLSDSSNNTLINNTCNYNIERGIGLGFSSNVSLITNTCNDNDLGIILHYSPSNFMKNNTLNNNRNGMLIYGSSFCHAIFNHLQDNVNYSIYLTYSSHDNTIFQNNFLNNNLGGTSQACDDGATNLWYDNSTDFGNYWSDWTGVGDYSIAGNANAIDPYPLSSPVV